MELQNRRANSFLDMVLNFIYGSTIGIVIISIMIFFVGTCGMKSTDDCLQLDILLVGDFSQSIDGHQGVTCAAFEAFANKFELGESNIKIGVLLFDDKLLMLGSLTSDKTTLRGYLNQVKTRAIDANSTTDFAIPLTIAPQELIGNGRKNVRKFIVFVSDGLHNGAGEIPIMAYEVKKQGIIIATVMIDRGNSALMENMASPGFYFESSYGELISTLKLLDLCL